MGKFIHTQNSFAAGQIDSDFYARDGINGLSRLENMDVIAGGGLKRRPGLIGLANLYATSARLIPFSVSETENYLIVLTPGHLLIYNGSTRIRDIITAWDADALPQIQYAQRFSTIIFVHPDYPPQVLDRTGGTTFLLKQFSFSRNDADMSINMPFMRFDDAADVTISVTTNSAGNNYATFTTNKSFWKESNVNGRLLLLGRQWIVTEYVSPTVVVAYTNGTYAMPTSAVSDWREATFSERRGWPCSISFYQDRLVFGGSRDWPSGIWMSQVGRHNNFDVGTGLDDEAIFITLLSQHRQHICTVVSSDTLQVLTSEGEWAISSNPLTPSSVDIRQHTYVGSVASRYLPPQRVEGSTVFISATRKDIRELTLDALGEKYSATDLCAMSKSLMGNPIDIAYNEYTRQLFVVMMSGEMAVLNKNAALGISAWGTYRTRGQFRSVAVLGGKTYVIVVRNAALKLERFDSDAFYDAGEYKFTFVAQGLPFRAAGHNPRRIRIRKISARVLNTKSLFINGRRVSFPNKIYHSPIIPGYSGDVSIGLLGTHTDTITPMWKIEGSDTLSTTVLSVSLHGWYDV